MIKNHFQNRRLAPYAVVFAALLFVLPFASAQDTPETLRDQAYRDIKTGQEFMSQASQIVRGRATRNDIEVGINLYTKAGQFFEKASKVFNMLGTDYVSQTDIDGARETKELCLASISRFKERLKRR